MNAGIIGGWYSPHPPIIIPAVGQGEEKEAQATIEAMQQAAAAMVDLKPETIILIGSHGPIFSDSFSLEVGPNLSGSFASFGAAGECITVTCDQSLLTAVLSVAEQKQLPLAGLTDRLKRRMNLPLSLDHGALVPLWYLRQAGSGDLPPLVIINVAGLPLEEHYALGVAIQAAVQEQGKRVGIIASGDLSHRLSPVAPAGYHPEAHLFDEAVTEIFASQSPWDLARLEELGQVAGECGLRPLVVFLGCFEGLAGESKVLSYEAPWGVGYLVAWQQVSEGQGAVNLPRLLASRQARVAEQRANESPLVRLARQAVETYVGEGRVLSQLPPLPAELPVRAGAFVTIYKHGQLRGCIGTTEPTCPTLAAEIVRNAISAATEDPRFYRVEPEELASLVYSVDVLGEPEAIANEEELDPETYGVIVERGRRRGLLLPDLPGIDSIQEQVRVAKLKAGIGPQEPVKLYRFTVTRFH
ncbi:MAG: AmmeMemoRadiSam system protein A [Firmicutes bacterium]|nr:AmmeMemoRadiSam system protein A [Bacillota bacterium]